MTEVDLTVHDGVAVVTLNAPQRRNAITVEMAHELVATLDKVDSRDDVGAAVIQGAVATFCAGADLAGLRSLMTDPASDEAYSSLEAIYRSFVRVGELRVPSIAAVRGDAVGAGVNLAFAADVRIVARDARFRSGFARLGLHPGGGHFQLLSRVAGPEVAAAMGVFGEDVRGERAVAVGLAWEAVDDADVEQRALTMAAPAGADPQLARRTISSLRGTTASPIPWQVALQAERSPQLWSLRRAGARRAADR